MAEIFAEVFATRRMFFSRQARVVVYNSFNIVSISASAKRQAFLQSIAEKECLYWPGSSLKKEMSNSPGLNSFLLGEAFYTQSVQ